MDPSQVERRIVKIARERMTETAVLALQGARSVGKSTVMKELAEHFGVGVIDLDDSAQLALVAAAPADYVTGVAPVCIDEFQRVPPVSKQSRPS